MSFGLHIPFLTVVLPDVPEGDLSFKTPPFGSLEELEGVNTEDLKPLLFAQHERSHFFDMCSSPLGFSILLMEHARIFAQSRLLYILKDHSFPKPLKLPVADFLLGQGGLDPTLEFICKDHRRLRNAVQLLRFTYYGRGIDDQYGYRMKPKGVYTAAGLIPIFNRHFLPPRVTQEHLDQLVKMDFETIDIVECLALLVEFNLLAIFQVSEQKEGVDRFLRLAPRAARTAKLYSAFTALKCFQGAPFMPRYVLWKALTGPICVPHLYDHGEVVDFTVQHPVFRLMRLWTVLEAYDGILPEYKPYLSNVGDLLETDEVLSQRAGLETLGQARSFFLSRSPGYPSNLNPVEKGVLGGSNLFYEQFSVIFREIWTNIEDWIDYAVMGFRLGQQNSSDDNMLNRVGPLLELAGDSADFREVPGKSTAKIVTDICMGTLALELDSFRRLGLVESIAKSNLPHQIRDLDLKDVSDSSLVATQFMDHLLNLTLGCSTEEVLFSPRLQEDIAAGLDLSEPKLNPST